MTLDEMKAERVQIEKDIQEKREDFQKLQESMMNLSKRHTKIKDDIFEEEVKGEPSIECIMGLNWSELTTKQHSKVSKVLNGISGTHIHGFYPETGQVAVSVCLYKDKPLSEQLGVLDLIPFIKPFPSGEHAGNKRLGVFEYTLSQGGVFNVEISPNGEVGLNKSVYHRTRSEKIFKDIMDALAYIQINHYYE